MLYPPLAKDLMAINLTIENKDLKNYPHFDAPLSKREIRALVSNTNRVASNRFYPLLSYVDEWQPYRSLAEGKPEKKSRPIRYASRRDAYIFAHYRKILLERYEAKLTELNISECPIAYRKIAKDTESQAGKCNIDFAKDAFDEVKSLGNCVAIALDIKGYFDNLDHNIIKQLWLELLAVERLPEDHFTVFKNITNYQYVDQKNAYRRLGYLSNKNHGGHEIEGYTIPYREMPKQLCSPSDFREKICGKHPEYQSLVQKNSHNYGIPQGAPISDLIANFYLMHFDKAVFEYVKRVGGRYMRYSDDILLILPGGTSEAQNARQFVGEEIIKHGSQLVIKDEKTCIVQFNKSSDGLNFTHIEGKQGKNGLEYLGFCFDGQRVQVRNSTISRFYGKVARAAKREAFIHIKNSGYSDVDKLLQTFNFSLLSQRFTRVRRTDFLSDDVRTWTFWTYLKRAAKAFGDDGQTILKQASGFKKFMHQRVEQSLIKLAAPTNNKSATN